MVVATTAVHSVSAAGNQPRLHKIPRIPRGILVKQRQWRAKPILAESEQLVQYPVTIEQPDCQHHNRCGQQPKKSLYPPCLSCEPFLPCIVFASSKMKHTLSPLKLSRQYTKARKYHQPAWPRIWNHDDTRQQHNTADKAYERLFRLLSHLFQYSRSGCAAIAMPTMSGI